MRACKTSSAIKFNTTGEVVTPSPSASKWFAMKNCLTTKLMMGTWFLDSLLSARIRPRLAPKCPHNDLDTKKDPVHTESRTVIGHLMWSLRTQWAFSPESMPQAPTHTTHATRANPRLETNAKRGAFQSVPRLQFSQLPVKRSPRWYLRSLHCLFYRNHPCS